MLFANNSFDEGKNWWASMRDQDHNTL